MDFNCPPDIDPGKDLTVDAVLLFQHHLQDPDKETVARLLDPEFSRHLKLCEAVILRQAAANFYWAELPMHAVLEINIRIKRHFAEKGFKVEVKRTARKDSAPSRLGDTALETVVIETNLLVSWLDVRPSPRLQAEFARRRKLEDEFLLRHPAQRQSTGFGRNLKIGAAIWATTLDNRYVVEVQCHFRRFFLCVFDRRGTLLHSEPTTAGHGGTFGPDAADIPEWQRQAEKVAALPSRSSRPSLSRRLPSPPSRPASRPGCITDPSLAIKKRPKRRLGPGG